MNDLAVRMVRSALRLIDGRQDAASRGAADILRFVLEVEGERETDGVAPECTPDDDARRAYERDRKARLRAAKRDMSRDVPDMSQLVPEVSPGHVPADVPGTTSLSNSPSSSLSEEIENKTETENREDARESRPVPALVPVDVPASVPGTMSRSNGTYDGAAGMLVTSWAEGIRSVTGADFPPPRGRAGGHLGEALRKLTDGAADVCVVAKTIGADYARANTGRTLSPFNFTDWVGSGKPDRASGVIARAPALVQPPGEGGKRLWKVGGPPK